MRFPVHSEIVNSIDNHIKYMYIRLKKNFNSIGSLKCWTAHSFINHINNELNYFEVSISDEHRFMVGGLFRKRKNDWFQAQ